MTDRQLECIAAIAHHQSMTGAAKQLYVSQSSLSQMLTKTEKELGVQLFRRTGTSMIPTYAGDQYLKAAEEISKIKQNLTYHLKNLNQSNQGRITVGISQKRSSLFMPVVLSSYMKKFPDVEIVFLEEDRLLLEDMAIRGDADVVFVTHPLLKQDLSGVCSSDTALQPSPERSTAAGARSRFADIRRYAICSYPKWT